VKLVWNCLAMFELRHWRLMLLLSAVSAKDFAEAIVMCNVWFECRLTGSQVKLMSTTGSSLGDVAIKAELLTRAGLHIDVQHLSALVIVTKMFSATFRYVFDLLPI